VHAEDVEVKAAQPNPAAQLRAAAQLLRERATAATPGPWQARGDYSDAIYSDTSEGIVDVIAGGKWGGEASVFDNEHDATWIAMMHPGVGEPLAAWLDATAAYCTVSITYPTHVVRALAVARALLGGES
jgi:hypothetical protein